MDVDKWEIRAQVFQVLCKGLGAVDFRLALAEAVEVSFVAFAVSGMFLPVAYHAGFYILAGMALAVKEIAKRALFVDNGTKI